MNCTPEAPNTLAKTAKNKPTIQVKQSGTSSAKSHGRKISPPSSPPPQPQSQAQTQVIQIKPPQSQNLPSLNSPHVPQHIPSPTPQQPAKPQNNDERIINLLGRILQIEKNDHKKRAMLLKSVKLFLSQKNPALTQPIISLFILVFKSVFSTAPPFSVITKSYRHIYFNPRDHPEDVSICYHLFEIINNLQPTYPNELLQSLVRRLSSASVDDRNGAKKCLMLIDEHYSSFLLHHLCLEMIPPPPHGIDTLLELTVEILKSYKSVSDHTNNANHSNETLQSLNPPNSPNANNNSNPQIQKLSSNPSLDSNKITNLKLNAISSSPTNNLVAPISVPNPNIKNSNNNQKPNQTSNKISKLSINSNSHSSLPTVPISIPNTNQKSDSNQNSNSKKNPSINTKQNANLNLNTNSQSKPNLITNPISKTNKNSNTISKPNTKVTNANPVVQPPNSDSVTKSTQLQKSSSSINLKPNPIIPPKKNIDNDAIFSNLKRRLELSADDSLFSELQRTLRLLHFAPHFQAFFQPLLKATKALISKNENLAHESRRFLLNYWPRLDPQKAVLFLQEATALCKEGPEIEEFVWQRLSWRASSIQWQIAMEGLNFITQTFQRAVNFDHSVLIFLLNDALQHHWNNNVKNKVADVIKLIENSTPRAPKTFPMDKWNLIKSQAECNYPNVDFNGRRRRKK